MEALRVPTSATWAPLLRALLRLWAAAFLAAGWPLVALGLAAAAVAGGVHAVAGLVRFLPVLGGRGENVVALRRGAKRDARPIVVCAHLDTHVTGGAPLGRAHNLITSASGLLVFAASIASTQGTGWRAVAVLVATESVVTIAWLARLELGTLTGTPDDNTSGLLALVRLADLVADGSQLRDVWLVATSGATSGNYGITTFLRRHHELKVAWIIEFDALGTGEVIAAPQPSRFPRPGTSNALVKAVSSAARSSGDPLTVRRVPRSHSDARAALRLRASAITLTEGLRPARGGAGPDPANAERAARIVDTLARSADGATAARDPSSAD